MRDDVVSSHEGDGALLVFDGSLHQITDLGLSLIAPPLPVGQGLATVITSDPSGGQTLSIVVTPEPGTLAVLVLTMLFASRHPRPHTAMTRR